MLADALRDVSRSAVAGVIRETRPLLEHEGWTRRLQSPATAPRLSFWPVGQRAMTRRQVDLLRLHYLRNLLTKVPKTAQPGVATLVRTIFDQADTAAVREQFGKVVDSLADKLPAAAEHLDAACEEVLAFTAFPREVWKQIWSNNPQERLNKEIRRRTDVVGIFPTRAAIIRLVGAVLAGQTDEWAEQHRYIGPDLLARCRLHLVTDQDTTTETPQVMAPETMTA